MKIHLINSTRVRDKKIIEVAKLVKKAMRKKFSLSKTIIKVAYAEVGGGFCYYHPHLKIPTSISVPIIRRLPSSDSAQRFVDTMLHELYHVYDHLTNKEFAMPSIYGRRPRHKYRVEEKRVQEYIAELKKRPESVKLLEQAVSIIEIDIRQVQRIVLMNKDVIILRDPLEVKMRRKQRHSIKKLLRVADEISSITREYDKYHNLVQFIGKSNPAKFYEYFDEHFDKYIKYV